MKVLIVDDESLVRRSLKKAFTRKGHEVAEAENGLEGETRWTEFKPDVVVLDVLMPGLTGPQLMERMAGVTDAKVVLISAYAGDYNLDSAQKMGAQLFIQKPFESVLDVVTAVEELF